MVVFLYPSVLLATISGRSCQASPIYAILMAGGTHASGEQSRLSNWAPNCTYGAVAPWLFIYFRSAQNQIPGAFFQVYTR